MNNTQCELCGETTQAETDKLCSRCLEMEKQINHLIENHKETARKYIGKKLAGITDRGDRRVEKYKPGWGTHTADRRKGNRREIQASDTLKRRNSDQ